MKVQKIVLGVPQLPTVQEIIFLILGHGASVLTLVRHAQLSQVPGLVSHVCSPLLGTVWCMIHVLPGCGEVMVTEKCGALHR